MILFGLEILTLKYIQTTNLKIMKIEMKQGFEITEEIQKIASGYDFNTCYIDSYTQMKRAEERNKAIMSKLKELGVEKLKN